MVSKLTWGLQHTKENTGGISPHWQPSKNPELGTCASTRRDKASVYRSTADLSTFAAGIYSALCNENLHFKRPILQLERTRAAKERGEGKRAGDFCAFQGHWDVFLLRIACAEDSASCQLSCAVWIFQLLVHRGFHHLCFADGFQSYRHAAAKLFYCKPPGSYHVVNSFWPDISK